MRRITVVYRRGGIVFSPIPSFANLNEMSCNSAIIWKYNSEKVQLAKVGIGEILENREKVQLAKGGIGEITVSHRRVANDDIRS